MKWPWSTQPDPAPTLTMPPGTPEVKESTHDGQLREFVYLDEVSVNSLLASRDGHVVTQLTDNEASLLEAELKGSGGINTGFTKAEAGARLAGSRESGSQVVRKSIVQSAFKDLYDPDRSSLSFRALTSDTKAPSVKSLEDLRALVGDEQDRQGWVLTPADLERGVLAEVVVELEPESMFKFQTILSTVIPLLMSEQSIIAPSDQAQLQEPAALGRILSKMLAGLVPLRSQMVEFQWVELDGAEIVVHRRILSQLEHVVELAPHAVFVAGVAEEALFWKDLRRLLFARSQYSVLMRISKNALQNDWTPVKLVDVLRGVLPAVADQLGESFRDLPDADDLASVDAPSNALAVAMKNAARNYAEAVNAALPTVSLPTDAESIQKHVESGGTLDSVSDRLQVFLSIDESLGDAFTIDSDTALNLRLKALDDAGIEIDGSLRSAEEAPQIEAVEEQTDRIIESELIAIYW